jgi:Zn-dependent protease
MSPTPSYGPTVVPGLHNRDAGSAPPDSSPAESPGRATQSPGRKPPGEPQERTGVLTRGAIPLGHILGIRIGLDYSWFIVFVLLTWMLAAMYYPSEFHGWPVALYWVMGAVTAILLFVSVLLHELGHSVVAMKYHIPVRSITLFIFGGVAQIGAEPPRPSAEFLIAIAGPIVSFALAVVFYVLALVLVPVHPLFGLASYLALINGALVAFNLIPGFPLDGGRVFRAIVWAINRNFRRATLIAANVGRAFAFIFIFLGLWQMFAGNFGGGLWIAFIGWFLETAASAQIHQVAFQSTLAGHKVSEAMTTKCPVVSPTLTLQQLVDEHVLPTGRRCYVVGRDAEAVGLLTLHHIKETPRSGWATTTVGDVMVPLETMKHTQPDAELWNALQEMDRDGVNQLPVINEGKLVGMLSRDDVITHLRRLQEIGALAPR